MKEPKGCWQSIEPLTGLDNAGHDITTRGRDQYRILLMVKETRDNNKLIMKLKKSSMGACQYPPKLTFDLYPLLENSVPFLSRDKGKSDH